MSWQRVPAGRVLSADDKALPAWAAGMDAEAFVARGVRLSELWTPALVVDASALEGNAAFLAEWVAGRGLELMPHGKTTMAPQLWHLQQDAGATALTLATPWQVRVARAAGIRDIMLANQFADADAAAALALDVAEHGGRLWSWVDGDAGIDLLEVSGGTYEQLEFFKPRPASEIRSSTREREAVFLEYAKAIKAVARMPIMVTGGFRTLAGMEAALVGGHTDLIGLARPFCLDPDFPARMFSGQMDRLPVPEDRLVLGRGFWGPNGPASALRALNNQAQAGWYYHQIERLGAGLPPEPGLSPLRALVAHFVNDFGRALRRKLA